MAQNKELATEGMKLINTGFFDKAITYLINSENGPRMTLKKSGVVLYMGIDNSEAIVDAACCLVRWNPIDIILYAGEQRYNLNNRIEKTFSPLVKDIQNFRINVKAADKFPCLTLLCLVENKATRTISEWRRHYTAQSGEQLTIPGFNQKQSNALNIHSPLNILGKPKNIPVIRKFV